MCARDYRGFTLIELLIVVAIIGTLGAIAVPGLLRSRMAGNEAAAIGSMRSLTSAQEDYNALNRGYADDLANLATACPGMTTSFLSADLGFNGITKTGYIFSVVAGAGGVAGPNDCSGATTTTNFYATATPESFGFSGSRAFAANIMSAIWQDTAGVPPTEPFTAGGTISPLGQ